MLYFIQTKIAEPLLDIDIVLLAVDMGSLWYTRFVDVHDTEYDAPEALLKNSTIPTKLSDGVGNVTVLPEPTTKSWFALTSYSVNVTEASANT